MYNWQLNEWPQFRFDESLFISSEKEFLFRKREVPQEGSPPTIC